MTRCQVAQGNQNKMAKLPRTSLMCMLLRRETDILALSTTCEADPVQNTICQREANSTTVTTESRIVVVVW